MKCPTILTLLWCASATGQVNTFEFVASNVVSPEQPSATIEVWAAFDPSMYAFAKARFDLFASPGSGGFSDPVLRVQGPGDYEGDIPPEGDSVTNVAPYQFVWDNGGPYADPSNPILIWSVTWSTSDFQPRTVALTTKTSEYYLYLDWYGLMDDSLEGFVEGSGAIQVVPSPASAVVLFAAPCMWLRRLRTRCVQAPC